MLPWGVSAQTDEPAAQSETQPKLDKRRLLVQPRNADDTASQTSLWSDPGLWIREKQQDFYRSLSGTLRKLRTDAQLAAMWTLLFLSFGYGVFHAAGPGHGKAVISAWLLATENELRRGVLISFMSAFVQAMAAILIVSILLLAVSAVGSTARDVAGFLESASYALIGVMGLYLIWTAIRPQAHAHSHAHARHDDHHYHDHHPIHDEHCGHAHVPEASQVKGDWSLAKACALAFSVGIRPCTGAILALVFANAIGLYWAGILSTFVMALGTAITVSVIAALAVYSKKLALRLVETDARWPSLLAFALRLGGGLVIAVLGAFLFWGSLGTVNASM
jgi:ABC-type nickel/cobalt efflux system permease component RcnA